MTFKPVETTVTPTTSRETGGKLRSRVVMITEPYVRGGGGLRGAPATTLGAVSR